MVSGSPGRSRSAAIGWVVGLIGYEALASPLGWGRVVGACGTNVEILNIVKYLLPIRT